MRNSPLRSLCLAISSPSTSSSSSFSTSNRTSSQSKGKGKEVTNQNSSDSTTSNLPESIKSLMRISAQSVGVITSYIQQPSSTSSQKEERSVHGATLSSFTTVSLEPPIVAFSLRTPSRLADALLCPPMKVSNPSSTSPSNSNPSTSSSTTTSEAHFIINILSSTQSSIASSFAKPGLKHYSQKDWKAPSIKETDSTIKQRLEEGHHPLDLFPHQPSEIAGGVPFLNESIGALACSVLRKFDLDDFDGLVQEGKVKGQERKSDGSQLFLARVHAVEGMEMGKENGKDEKLPLVYWKQKFCTVGDEVE